MLLPRKLAERIRGIVNFEAWQGEIFRQLQAALSTPSHIAQINQCDGCQRGLRVENGIHYDGGHVVMCCTAKLYAEEQADNGRGRLGPAAAPQPVGRPPESPFSSAPSTTPQKPGETPRTDALSAKLHDLTGGFKPIDLWDHARQLERELAEAMNRCDEALEAAEAAVSQRDSALSATPRRDAHSLEGERDSKLLSAFTPARTAAPGFEIEHWNLTMVRMKGDVVLSVRLPSEFSHYVQTAEGRMAAWHPGAVSSVRFTRELWPSFVEQVAEADKVFKACDSLDAIL